MCLVFPDRNSWEGRGSEGARGVATLSVGEEGGSQAASCPSLMQIWPHWGQRVPLSLALLSKDGRRTVVCLLPLSPCPDWQATSLGTRPHGLLQLQVLRFSCWKMLGRGAVRAVLCGLQPPIPTPNWQKWTCPTNLLVEEEHICWSAQPPANFLSHNLYLKKKSFHKELKAIHFCNK